MPALDVWSARLTANTDLLPLLAQGTIVAKPALQELDGAEAVFADATRAPADVILNCTGYALAFPFLAGLGLAMPGATIDLYKHVFHPAWPGLAFIGLPVVAGPLPPVAELQARWAARVLRGVTPLPGAEAMRAEIAQRRAWLAPRTRYPMRVQLPDYFEELAGLAGVRPRLLRHPALLGPLLLGPVTAAQYRLDGPGRWAPAAASIRATWRGRLPSPPARA